MNESVTSENGEFIAINQGDGNFVVYERFTDGSLGEPVWDMWSHKTTHENGPPAVEPSPQPLPQPLPEPNIPDIPSAPSPAGIVGVPVKITQGCNPIGMAYWRNINQHRGQDILKVFLTINDELILFIIDKRNLSVLSEKQLNIHHTGEGCYFSAVKQNILFVRIEDTLFEYNVDDGSRNIVWKLTDGNKLWQCHTSYNDDVHSATIQNSNYNFIKWGVSIRGEQKFFDMGNEPDECQIDKSGNFLVVKESNINRIIDLRNNDEKFIPRAGRLGHSDCGFECMLGENDFSEAAGACDYVDLNDISNRRRMYSTGIWNMGYASFTNAKPSVSLDQQFCLISTPRDIIQVRLDGNGNGRIICPNFTEDQEYNNRSKANLCPQGEFAIWTALVSGVMTAFIVRVPPL